MNVYQNQSAIARTLGVSRKTVSRILPEIEEQVGKRYPKYSILDGIENKPLIHIAVAVDYFKYRPYILDGRYRLPTFDLHEAMALMPEGEE